MTSSTQDTEIERCPVCYDSFEDHNDKHRRGKRKVVVKAVSSWSVDTCFAAMFAGILSTILRSKGYRYPGSTIGHNKDTDADDAHHLNYCEAGAAE
jgi:hypothetical protein